MECSHNLKCLKSEIGSFLKGRDIKSEICLHCVKDCSKDCPFEKLIGDELCCECPLRIRIARELKRNFY